MYRNSKRPFRRTSLWLAWLLGVLGGLGAAYYYQFFGSIYILFAVLILAGVSLRTRRWVTLWLLLLLGLLCGWWRGDIFQQKLAVYDRYYGQHLTVTVQAMGDGVYDKKRQLSFDATNIRLETGEKLTGKMQVGGFGENAIFQGDEIEVSGKLFPGYGSYQGKMSFANIHTIAHHPTIINEIKRRFVAGVQTALPDPQGPFIMGLLVGQRVNLPGEVKDHLTMVGLTHIIAVSGANLTIILNACRKLLGQRSKRIATFLTLAFIGVFLLLTGGSASIVRAAVVSVLSIAASYYGRSFRPLNLIALAAALTAFVNPIYIWSDLGWYLSFLAFFGVMVLSPLIQRRWPHRWHQNILGAVALESICAEIMSLPFVLHIFGQMSLVGLPANMLVVTLVPLAMLLGFVAGIAGMLVPALAGWVAWPATIALTYMLDVARILAGLPHIFITNRSLSLAAMLMLYVMVALFVTVLWRKTKAAGHAIITDINESKTRGLFT